MGVFNGWQICGMEIRPWINMPLRVVIVFVPMFFKYLLTSLSNGGLAELKTVMMLNALLFIIGI